MGCKHINLDTEQTFQLVANRAEIRQCGLRRGLYQQIEVTVCVVLACEDRAKHPNITDAVTQRNLTDACSIQGKGF